MKKQTRGKPSKRVLLKNKHKVIRKVKEHQRKERKEAKKNLISGQSKLKKDPGIPNLWPFKEQMLQQMEKKKHQMEVSKKLMLEQKKSERERLNNLAVLQKDALKRQRNYKDNKDEDRDDDDDDDDYEDDDDEVMDDDDDDAVAMDEDEEDDDEDHFYDDADDDDDDNDNEKRKKGKDAKLTNKSALDQSKRQHYRELQKIVKNADVILQVLDARDPLGCRCKAVEEYIMNKDPDKRIILVLNKVDLIPKNVAEDWLKYLRNEMPTIAFKASTQSQKNNLGQSNYSFSSKKRNGFSRPNNNNNNNSEILNTSECIGADALVQLLKNYARNKNLKTSIRVGVIGLPNTGKSSVINSLKRRRVATAGATPGLTKTVQEIQLDKNIRLLDCPGIVFSKKQDNGKGEDVDIILRNCVKIEQLTDVLTPIASLIKRCDAQQLMEFYSIASFQNATQFLNLIAMKKGKLKKGGIIDLEAAGRAVLQDWVSGRINFYTLPPSDRAYIVDSKIVTQWSNDFNIDEVKQTDLPNTTKEGLCLQPTSIEMGDDTMLTADVGGDEDEEEDEDDDDDDAMEDDEDDDILDDDDEDDDEEEEDDDDDDNAKNINNKSNNKSNSKGNSNKTQEKPKIFLQPPKQSKKESSDKNIKRRKLDEEDEEIDRLNPQLNKQRKMLLKKQQKVKRKDRF